MAKLTEMLTAAYRLHAPFETTDDEDVAADTLDAILAMTATPGRGASGGEFDFVRVQPAAPSKDQPLDKFARRSHRDFAPFLFTESDLASVLCRAFPPSLAASGRRSYPSAGGLYPVELFGIDIAPHRQQSTLLAYRFEKGSFEHLPGHVPVNEARSALLDLMECPGESNYGVHFSDPAFALVYVIHKSRATARYGARGARFAIMEVGALYQQISIAAGEIGVANCLFGATPDARVMNALRLEAAVYGYCATHVFGHPA